jgi:hypothetical protein
MFEFPGFLTYFREIFAKIRGIIGKVRRERRGGGYALGSLEHVTSSNMHFDLVNDCSI